jgi:hypothetical protein
MHVSQLATLQGWTSHAPVVGLTLYPLPQEVQLELSVQIKQLAIEEQLAQ